MPWLGLVVFLLGCTGNVDPAARGAVDAAILARYLGVWRFDSGTVTENCTDGRSVTDNLAGSMLAIDPGPGAQVVMLEASNCQAVFEISGERADLVDSEPCVLTGTSAYDGTYRGTVTFTRGALWFYGSGLGMSHSYELYVKWQSGATVRCFGEKVGGMVRPTEGTPR